MYSNISKTAPAYDLTDQVFIGIEHNTAGAGVVGIAIRHSTSCVGPQSIDAYVRHTASTS